MPKRITVDVDEVWPFYDMQLHKHDIPSCAVEISDADWARLQAAGQAHAWAQNFLKDVREIQKLKWSYNHDQGEETQPR